MTYTELQKMTAGKFIKVSETERSIVVGTIGALTEELIDKCDKII